MILLTLSTLSNFNGLFHSLFWIKLKRSVVLKGLKPCPFQTTQPNNYNYFRDGVAVKKNHIRGGKKLNFNLVNYCGEHENRTICTNISNTRTAQYVQIYPTQELNCSINFQGCSRDRDVTSVDVLTQNNKTFK